MTRAEKIEALALDLEAAWSGIQSKPTDRPNKHWLRAATVAQDRIDAAGVVWTPMTERAPEGVRDYLVTYGLAGWRAVTQAHYLGSVCLDGAPLGYTIFAWAPLPEPWRG